MPRLILLERVILESLSRSNATANQISADVGLNLSWVKSLLYELTKKGLVAFDGLKYSLDMSLNRPDEESVKLEVKELASSMIEGHFKSSSETGIRLLKVSMTEKEKMIFDTLVKNLENYVEELQSKKGTEKTSEQQVVLLGQSRYGELVGDYISYNTM